MAIQYHVYANDGAGGPVDYTTPIATTASLTFLSAVLAAPSSTIFAVRAFDTVTGFEDLNNDARVTVNINAAGADIANQPIPPIALTGTAQAAGKALVRWRASVAGLPAGRLPTGFHVYQGTPTVSYASPVATVPYVKGLVDYSRQITGLADETIYQFAVRSYNATAEEANTVVVSVEAETTGPDPIDSLTGTVG